MRIERMSGITSALPSPEFQSVSARPHSFPSYRNEGTAPSNPVLEEIAMQFDMRDMDAPEAALLAERLIEEELLTSAACYCLTGVPMSLVAVCQPLRSKRGSKQRYDYISEFERYVAFELSERNPGSAELFQTVLNLLYSLDTLRRNGPVNISA